MTVTKNKTYRVKNRVGSDFVEDHIKKPLEDGIIEGVINSIIWRATLVRIITKGTELEIIDNGVGLIGEGEDSNKNGILRPGDSPGKLQGKKKGNKGTGIKGVFSNTKHTWIVSPPADDPGMVCMLPFSYQEYLESLKPEAPEMEYTIAPLNEETWPFLNEFRTGLWLRFLLKSKPKYSAERLAKALSARLLSKYRDLNIVTVNGQPLPARKIIGDYVSYDQPHDKLDTVRAEFYNVHPDDRVSEDGLYVGGRVVAEASFKALLDALDDDVRKLVPLVFFTTKEICGSLIITFLEEYATPDRKSFRSEMELPNGEMRKLSQDPRLMALILWMRSVDAEVRETLKIKIGSKSGSETTDKTVSKLCDMINSATGGPVKDKIKDDDDLPPPPKPPKPDEKKSLSLSCDREEKEYELGEVVSIRARIHKSLLGQYSRSDIVFHTHQSHGTNPPLDTADGVSFTVSSIGEGRVSAVLNSIHDDSISYKVVVERIFRIKPAKTLKKGESYTLTCMNMDKAKLPLAWNKAGVGILESHGETATFTSDEEGEATITVVDSSTPPQPSECKITVVKPEEEVPANIVKIEDEQGNIIYFRYSYQGILSDNVTKVNLPVQMIRTGRGTERSPYTLWFHRDACGFAAAEKAGILEEFLFGKICEVFPYFMHLEVASETYTAEAWPALRERLSIEGNKLFERILTKRKK